MLTKTWQDDWKAILHIHKRVLLIIFKRIIDQMKLSQNENFRIIQYFQNYVTAQWTMIESIKK